jgi:hypothetical protein
VLLGTQQKLGIAQAVFPFRDPHLATNGPDSSLEVWRDGLVKGDADAMSPAGWINGGHPTGLTRGRDPPYWN